MFLLFAGYEIWFVFHGMLAPRSSIGNGTLLLGFFLMLKMRMVWNGWQGILVVEENKYWKVQKVKQTWISTLCIFVLNCCCKFWGRIHEFTCV